MYSIIISPPAEIDIREIQDYYDNLVYGLGEKFILTFGQVLELLEHHPKLYPIIENEIRRIFPKEFKNEEYTITKG